MKLKALLLALTLGATLLVGCGSGEEPPVEEVPPTTEDTQTPEDTDVVSSASIANDEATLEKALKESWIITLKSDIKTDKELLIEGEFTKPDKEDATKMVPAGRKLALYDQDADRNKTATYTLTAPKLIVKSKDTKIQGGTFVGDVYVEADGFSIKDAKVEGNVYFSKQEYKDTYVLDEGGSVTGVQEVK